MDYNHVKSEEKLISRILQISPVKNGSATFRCEFCTITCDTESSLVSHLQQHIWTILNQCKSCKEWFTAQNALLSTSKENISIVAATDIKEEAESVNSDDVTINDMFENDRLQDELVDSPPDSNLELNVSSVKVGLVTRGEKFFKCKQCGKCSKMKNFHRHMKTHEVAGKPFVCIKCGKCFALLDYLNHHMRIHSDVKRFTCTICGTGFRRRDYLVKHEIARHSQDKPFMCSSCGRCFAQKSALTTHYLTHDKSKLSKHICSHCGKNFGNKAYIKSHILKIHLKEEQFECVECGKPFSTKNSLSLHEKTHRGELPYSCSECASSFASPRTLKTHIFQHTSGRKQFACEFCDKSFNYKCSLQSHTLLHSGQKPYLCNICQKSFRQLAHVRRHILKLHPDSELASAVAYGISVPF